MSGQVFGTNSEGGYMYSDELSDEMRSANFPLCKFRPLCDIPDFEAKGLHKGSLVHWNIYQDVQTQGTTLNEGTAIPQTNFLIGQGTATLQEWGNSIPFTQKLDDLAAQPVREVIKKLFVRDQARTFDTAAYNEFNKGAIRVVGTATDGIVTTTNGTATATNSVALSATLLKNIVDDVMKEYNMPPYSGDDYVAVGRPSGLRQIKDDLESIEQYTDAGFTRIVNGEKGRYYGVRFVEQTQISSGSWTNSVSDKVVFMGADTVAEAVAIPEEIRGKIPGDYGRDRGLAWYALLNFALVRDSVNQTNINYTDTRVVVWDSAA